MVAGESLEQQLEARDPDIKLMLQVRDDVQGAFEVLVDAISIGFWGYDR